LAVSGPKVEEHDLFAQVIGEAERPPVEIAGGEIGRRTSGRRHLRRRGARRPSSAGDGDEGNARDRRDGSHGHAIATGYPGGPPAAAMPGASSMSTVPAHPVPSSRISMVRGSMSAFH